MLTIVEIVVIIKRKRWFKVMEMLGTIGMLGISGIGTLLGGALLLLIPIYIIGMAVLQYYLAVKYDDKKIIILIVFAFLNFPGCIVCAIVYSLVYQHKLNNQKSAIFAKLTSNPDDSVVDEYIAHLNKFACEDTPNAWHQVRGVWYAVNNSANVTTAKKQELLTILLVKGLFLTDKEKQIIDNYGR